MTTQTSRIPVLGEDGRFPDVYAPASVALDAQAAAQAKADAQGIADGLPAAADAAVASELAAQVPPAVAAEVAKVTSPAGLALLNAADAAAQRMALNVAAIPAHAFDPIADMGWHSAMWADRLSGVTNGDRLSIAADASGNLRDWVQPVAAKKPQYLAGAFNGRGALLFAGSHGLVGPVLSAAIPKQAVSVYAVASATTNNTRVVGYKTSGGTNIGILGISSAHLVQAGSGPALNGPARTGNIRRVAVIGDTAGLLHVDGVDYLGEVGIASTMSQFAIGSLPDLTLGLNGFIAFVGFKLGRFTTDEIAALDAWAYSYYGIAGHLAPTNETWTAVCTPRAVSHGGKTYVGVTTEKTGAAVNVYTGTNPIPAKYPLTADASADDHNNPALVIRPGKPIIALHSRHSTDSMFRWNKSTANVGEGTLAFAAEKTLDIGGGETYHQAHTHGDNIWVAHRGPTVLNWGLLKSTDWGETFTNTTIISSGYQMYCATARYGTDTLRVAASNHPKNGAPPDQNIYYCEVNLATGSITKSDGTVLGNLNGTNLPLAIGSLELIAAPPAGHVTWIHDVSDAPVVEVAWSSFDLADIPGTGMYKYSKLTAPTTWTTRDVVATGGTFTPSAEPYVGCIHFLNAGVTGGGQGQVFLVRKDAAGTFHVERRVTKDAGATWITTVIESSAEATQLARPWPTERHDSTPTWPIFAIDAPRYQTYWQYDATVRPVGTPS